MDTYKVMLTFTSPVLGTVPKNREVYEKFVAGKAEKLTGEQLERELETVVEEIEERGWTGFHTINGKPHLHIRHVKGFLKAACGALRRVPSTKSAKVRAYKKVIDTLVSIVPDFPEIVEPDEPTDPFVIENMTIGEQRPLRAQTAQGERITLARSDVIAPGATVTFALKVLGVVTEAQLREWFDYGEFSGISQWRGVGYGRFTYTLEKQE